MTAVVTLEEFMCEEHRTLPMGHDECHGAGEPAYHYTGWAQRIGNGRVYLRSRTLVGQEFHRYERLVTAVDHDGVGFEITYADWFGDSAPA